jgi:osmotically-inducible protein OsmY
MASPGPDRVVVDDATLTRRIRSEVFGKVDVPKDRIALDVTDGVATLRGELDSQTEVERLADRVRSVPGVVDVVVLIHLPGTPAPNKEAALEASREAEAETRAKRSTG